MSSFVDEERIIRQAREAARSQGRGAWLTAVAPFAVFAILAVLLMWRSLLGDVFLPLDLVPHLHPWRFSYERVPVNNPIISDVVLQVYPRRVFTNGMLRQGVLPLWNPLILTGTPLIADGQMTFFYPPSLLLALLPLTHAFGYFAFVQVLLAALGCYLAARQVGCGRGAATIAGTAYMFSGYLLTWLQYPHHSGASAMLPWCFWAVARACAYPSWGRWLVAGFILTMPLLVHIQIAFYTYVAAGLFVLVELVRRRTAPERLRLVAGFGLAFALALMLSAAQLLPQIALSSEGQRLAQISDAITPEAQFKTLLRLVLPTIGGQPRSAPPAWGPAILQTPVPYAGIVPIGLAICALLWSRRRSSAYFAVLAIGSFALALNSPLVQLFLLLFPPYRQFAAHERWFALWGFALPMLAGLGAQALIDRGDRQDGEGRRTLWLNRVLLGATALFLVVWAWQHLQLFTPMSRYGVYLTAIRQQAWAVPLLLGAAAVVALPLLTVSRIPAAARWGCLVVLVAGDLLWCGGSFNTSVSPAIFKPTSDLVEALPKAGSASDPDQPLYPLTRQIDFLLREPGVFRFSAGDYPALVPNLAMAFGLDDVRGYQSLYLARYNRLVRLIDGKDYTRLAGEGLSSYKPYLTSAHEHRRLLDMLNVRYILFPPGSKNVPLYQPLELVHRSDEGTIYRNPSALPRAWLVHQVEVHATDDAQLDRLARPDFDPATTAILPEPVAALGLPGQPEPVPAVEYGPNRLMIRAEVAAPAVLVVSDAYDEGWHVSVDGKPAPLLRANYALRGVWLPAGTHEVVFTYRARAVAAGGALSVAGLLVLMGGGLWSLRERARIRARNTPVRYNARS